MPRQPGKVAPLVHLSCFKHPGCFQPEESDSLSARTPLLNTVPESLIAGCWLGRYHAHRVTQTTTDTSDLLAGPRFTTDPEMNSGVSPCPGSVWPRAPKPLQPLSWRTGTSDLPGSTREPSIPTDRGIPSDSQKAKPSIFSVSSLLPLAARETKGAGKDSLVMSHPTSIIGMIVALHRLQRNTNPTRSAEGLIPGS